MIYTELTVKAINTAFKAHEGSFDRSGLPYITHPLHVAESMETEDETVVAVLHDVIEDTDITLDDLRKEGFTETQLEAVRLLTHEDGISYEDYVKRLKSNPIARKVKLSDLRHNMDRTRIKDASFKDEKRYKKYEDAYKYLTDDNED